MYKANDEQSKSAQKLRQFKSNTKPVNSIIKKRKSRYHAMTLLKGRRQFIMVSCVEYFYY